MKITIIDYGMGNLYSVKNALNFLGEQCVITSEKEDITCADALILPGVGAFPDAMECLKAKGLDEAIKRAVAKNIPLLGICLGMQLLLTSSDEVRFCEGLSLISGRVEKIGDFGLKIPHMGWNDLVVDNSACPVLRDTRDGDYVYFVHSYKVVLDDEKNLAAHTFYGEKIPAVITNGKNVFGAQFHPEKSERVGLAMIKSFCDFCKSGIESKQ